MNTSALVLVIITQLSILGITAYFFYRVLKKPGI